MGTPIDRLRFLGRWRNPRTLEHYAQEAASAVILSQLPENVDARIVYIAARPDSQRPIFEQVKKTGKMYGTGYAWLSGWLSEDIARGRRPFQLQASRRWRGGSFPFPRSFSTKMVPQTPTRSRAPKVCFWRSSSRTRTALRETARRPRRRPWPPARAPRGRAPSSRPRPQIIHPHSWRGGVRFWTKSRGGSTRGARRPGAGGARRRIHYSPGPHRRLS